MVDQKKTSKKSRKNSLEKTSKQATIDLRKLNTFLKKNKAIDLRTADFLHVSSIEKYTWTGLAKNKQDLIDCLKAYQRLLRIVPEGKDDLAKKMLKSGIFSSLQIANTPKEVFVQSQLKLFDNDSALAEQVYDRAVALRKAVSLQYIARMQQSEAYVHTAKIGI